MHEVCLRGIFFVKELVHSINISGTAASDACLLFKMKWQNNKVYGKNSRLCAGLVCFKILIAIYAIDYLHSIYKIKS
jgi:hypothetical protein